jgi:outer membrane protein assembly factor BamB
MTRWSAEIAFLYLFSAASEQVQYGAEHYRLPSAETSSIVNDLFVEYRVEGLSMPYTTWCPMKIRLPLLAPAVLSFALAATAADWPQWRGPERNGISKETGLLKAWPAAGPQLLWQVMDVGGGYSTPAVVGDRLYLLGNKGNDDEFVQARAVKDGKRIWSTRLGKVGPNLPMASYPGARSTPTVDGDFLYALGSDGDLVCLKTTDGGEVWRKSLRKSFGGQPGLWAYAESPLIDGNVLVCTPGGKDATLVALDKQTGSLLWKAPVTGGDAAAYASPIVVTAGGVKQYVQFLSNGLVGVDAKTGKFLWRYDKTAAGSLANIPTPVAKGNYVYSSSGKGGCALVKLQADKGGVSAESIYYKNGLPNSIGGSVLLGNLLYGTNGRGLMCVEFMTGEEKWKEANGGAGAVCYADGMLYIHGEKNGDIALVVATPDAFHEKGRFTPPDLPARGRSKSWAYPVVANGRLYIRDLDVMWCYEVKAGK